MSQKSKLRLDELKIESFVTSVNESKKIKAGGGFCVPTDTCQYPTLKHHDTCLGVGCGASDYTCGDYTCSPSCNPDCETYACSYDPNDPQESKLVACDPV